MKPFVAVLDYGIGNLRSAQKALVLSGAKSELTADPEKILAADGLVLPGVGHFGTCMEALRERKLDVVIAEAIKQNKSFLAICVGMQMLFESSAEAPGVEGLGIFEGENIRLSKGVRVPQIQWNQIQVQREHTILDGLDESWMYFVHSFIPPLNEFCIATSTYGQSFPAVVAKGSVVATQFHPEKSGESGLRLINNFVSGLG